LHLASNQDDHQIIGELALSGRFQTGIFPNLGLHDGNARPLKEGPDFLDQASSQGALGCTVRDVAFGSVFPCVNAAGREMFTALVKKRQTAAINVEKCLQQRKEDPTKLTTTKAVTTETQPNKAGTSGDGRLYTLFSVSETLASHPARG
jgi:hypothetical protein